jgi:hypothetical protein
MDAWTRRQLIQSQSSRNSLGGACRLNSHFSTDGSTSFPGSRDGADALLLGSSTYKPKECSRYTGAALPPGGTPTPSVSLERLSERLEHLAFGARPDRSNAPPLETYTTTTSEHGDVYRATDEYVRWFHAQYPKAGTADRLSRRASSPPTKGLGGPEVSFGLEGVKDF